MTAFCSRRFALALAFHAALALPTVANAADPTLEKGYTSRRDPDKGIVLHLHGCGGLHTLGWVEAWFGHLEKSGFKVIAPDSFAEPRPAASCARPYPNKETIYSLRVAQTVRVLEALRQEYPNRQIYIWGHSEGGGLASRLSVDVSGIFTTGYDCGYGLPPRLHVRPDVRFLALIGDERIDHWLQDGLYYRKANSIRELCTQVLHEPSWRWIQLEDVGHLIPIWNPQVLTATNAFLGTSEAYTGPDARAETGPQKDIELSRAARKMFAGDYATLGKMKAFAIGPHGVFGYAYGWSNSVDAKATALYYCNKALLARLGGTERRCILYAVDDTVEPGSP